MVAGLRRRTGSSNDYQIHRGCRGTSDRAEPNERNCCRMRGPADGGTRSLGDGRGYTNSLNECTRIAGDLRNSCGLRSGVRSSAGCSDIYNSRVLRHEGGADTSEESKGGIFLLLGGAPGPNASANFVRELSGWTEA